MYIKYELEEKIGESLTVNLVAKSIMLTDARKQVITVTSCPDFTHSLQCSNVRVAGAFTSGGKLSVKNNIFIF